jgi:hypothetical protein
MARQAWLVLLAACGLAGCGSDNGLTMGRVSGTITFKGQPVEFGDILFAPDESKGNQGVPAMGSITKDGTYVLSTQDAGDGAIVGYHRVGIRVFDPTPLSGTGPPTLVPGVPAGKETMAGRISQRKALALERSKNRAKPDAKTATFNGSVYRFLVPDRLADPAKSGIAVKISQGSNRFNFAIQEDGSVKISE